MAKLSGEEQSARIKCHQNFLFAITDSLRSGPLWLLRLFQVVTLGLSTIVAVDRPAQARLVVHFEDVGGGVVMTGAGSLDISRWPAPQPLQVTLTSGVSGSSALLVNGFQRGIASNMDAYYGLSFGGPGAFGNRPMRSANRTSGDPLALALLAGAAYLPAGYSSGQPLQLELQWDRTSLTAMELVPGRLVYDWLTDQGRDHFEVLVGPQPVPSPAPFLGLPLAWRWTRRWRRLKAEWQPTEKN